MKLKLSLNISLYFLSFLIVHYIKYSNIKFQSSEIYFLLILLTVTAIISAITGKYKLNSDYFINKARIYFKSFIITLGLMVIITNSIYLLVSSRMLLLGSISLAFLIELITVMIKSSSFKEGIAGRKIKLSVSTLIIEFIVLVWIIIYSYYSIDFLDYIPLLEKIQFSVLILVIWFLNGLFLHQFSPVRPDSNFYRIIWLHIKAYILFILIIASFAFSINETLEVKELLIQQSILYSLWSTVVIGAYTLYKRNPKTDEVQTEIFKVTEVIERGVVEASDTVKQIGIYTFCYNLREDGQLLDTLKNVYLKKFDEVFRFIKESINIKSFDPARTIVIRSSDVYNVEVLPENSIELYMNLHELNDMRRINQYCILVNLCLQERGVFIGRYEPTRLRLKRFSTTFPFYISRIFYFFDFIWRRVFPKLPMINKFYFGLTKGRNRAISMAEMLGRLYFCGFDIVALKEIGSFQYFIASKIKDPVKDQHISYGPLFKMRRIGKNGRDIFVYKMRTMHPYSEFLQKFVFDKFSLEEGGKFRKDFRITSWGKILRKFWLDELPMIINLLKGDLKIVGVRPLSKHYYNLYPEDFREKRLKYKPGLVPPFYVDLPKSLDEIIESEKRYLDLYDKSPVITDIKYFFKAWYNIIVKNARSA